MDWLSHPTFEFRPELDVQGRYLLVVPKDLIMQWRTELRTRVNSDLKIVIYHPGPEEGHSINRSPSELAKADVVITTYETLRSDFEEMSQSEESFTRSHGKQWLGHHPLLVVYWLGVFFDEGHKLFNANTGMSQAAQALRSLFKIPITGTPLQNEYLECNTIMSLLQIEPFCSDSSAFRKAGRHDSNERIHVTDIRVVLSAATGS
jgi:SNF2 family DNA or RNA helicase